MTDFDKKLEYHEGFYAAGNDIPYDENASEAWKEGYRDGCEALYGDDDYHFVKVNIKE